MVEWNILLNILVAHGFDNLFYNLIWKCVLNSFFSVGKQLHMASSLVPVGSAKAIPFLLLCSHFLRTFSQGFY